MFVGGSWCVGRLFEFVCGLSRSFFSFFVFFGAGRRVVVSKGGFVVEFH